MNATVQLTPEQEAKAKQYNEKWKAVSLNTTPINTSTAQAAVNALYLSNGEPELKYCGYAASPAGATAIAACVIAIDRGMPIARALLELDKAPGMTPAIKAFVEPEVKRFHGYLQQTGQLKSVSRDVDFMSVLQKEVLQPGLLAMVSLRLDNFAYFDFCAHEMGGSTGYERKKFEMAVAQECTGFVPFTDCTGTEGRTWLVERPVKATELPGGGLELRFKDGYVLSTGDN